MVLVAALMMFLLALTTLLIDLLIVFSSLFTVEMGPISPKRGGTRLYIGNVPIYYFYTQKIIPRTGKSLQKYTIRVSIKYLTN